MKTPNYSVAFTTERYKMALFTAITVELTLLTTTQLALLLTLNVVKVMNRNHIRNFLFLRLVTVKTCLYFIHPDNFYTASKSRKNFIQDILGLKTNIISSSSSANKRKNELTNTLLFIILLYNKTKEKSIYYISGDIVYLFARTPI